MRPRSAPCQGSRFQGSRFQGLRLQGLRLVVLLIGTLGMALTAHAQERAPIVFPNTQYEPVDWTDLEGWDSDDHAAAFATSRLSSRLNAQLDA